MTDPKLYVSSVILRTPLPEDSYLARLPAVRWLGAHGALPLRAPLTFLVGENGTGKSTLLEAVAVAYGFNPEGGTKNFSFSTSSTHSELHRHLTLERPRFAKDGFFLRAESYYNASSYIETLDREDRARQAVTPLLESYGGVSPHAQSHGESFLSLVQNRFGGQGLYILDEPEAALSPARLLVLMAEFHALVKRDSQFLIATHSPILMTFPGAEIYALSESGIEAVTYQQTEHYQLAKRFLNHPERMLEHLLSD